MVPAVVQGNEMPVMQERPWEGYFVGHERRNFRFGIYANGQGHLIPHGRQRRPMSRDHQMRMELSVEEIKPGGKVVFKRAGQPSR